MYVLNVQCKLKQPIGTYKFSKSFDWIDSIFFWGKKCQVTLEKRTGFYIYIYK